MRRLILVFAALASLTVCESFANAQQASKPAVKAAPKASQKADQTPKAGSAKAAPSAKAQAAPGGKATAKATQKATQKATLPAAKLTPAQPSGDSLLQYVPDDVFVVGAIRPARLIGAPTLQEAIKAANGEDVVADLLSEATKEMGLDPSKVTEAGVFIDTATMTEFLSGQTKAQQAMQRQNNLRMIGLAMHNFYSTHNHLPDDDGFDDSKGKLSWRIHLLPYLDQTALYEQFHLDEPWDSEHNKTLIDKMPDVFKVEGVEDVGNTSIHLLTGEGTPFGGEEPPTFNEIQDGTSNTIMMVVAGADKADAWTKPGGLEIDPEAPLAALGAIGEQFDIGVMDGSVRSMNASVEPTSFLHMVQHQDGQVVNIPYIYPSPPAPIPGLIVRYSEPIDQEALLEKLKGGRAPQEIDIDGNTAYRLAPDASIMFPDAQTLLLSHEKNLKTMRAARGEAGELKAQFAELYPANDGVVVSNLELPDEDLEEVFQGVPFSELIKSLVKATVVLNATGNSDSLVRITVQTKNANSAQQIFGIANGGFQVLKGQILGTASQENSGIPEDVVGVLSELLDAITIEVEEETISVDMPKIDDPQKLFSDLNPATTDLFKGIRSGREQAKEMQKLNALRQMGLAMHNYHDVFNGFPSWNTPQGPGDNQGLSWRVHLLPYYGEAALYQQFHLDEPWDSEHNKALIEQMPEVYKCEGVEDAGKTSFHVFLGEDTPFGADKCQAIQNIVDGTSNTLMIVQAGPDMAEVWTKPSGLEYDPEDPKKCLGKIGDQIKVLFCDGSTRYLKSDIDNVTLRRLIEHADGEVVVEF